MNINDFKIGQSCELKKKFTEEDVLLFASLSMDTNPIHIDKQYAEKSMFGKQIVHGFLSSSLISAIIGTKMPGPGSIYINQNLNFKKPVYIGDEVKAIVTIKNIKYEKSIIYLETICYNTLNEITVEGEAIIKYT